MGRKAQNFETRLKENEKYLTSQLLTYLGNKRLLLPEIEKEVKEIQKTMGKSETVNVDLFSGSGCVARMLKQYSSRLIANDIEEYSSIINRAFLDNWTSDSLNQFSDEVQRLECRLQDPGFIKGIISTYYAPENTCNIKPGERAFYTQENAQMIDTVRHHIDTIKDARISNMMLAMLLIEASIHTNTSGVFKGFYKDPATGVGKFGGKGEHALSRIKGDIRITEPVVSNFKTESQVCQFDASEFFTKTNIEADITYIDPPYNQHPYGSNYFMLNVIASNCVSDDVSAISGIPSDWKRSNYNKRNKIKEEFIDLLSSVNSEYLIISYNNEGFLSYADLLQSIQHYGTVIKERHMQYFAFKGSRNLNNRAKHTKEYLIAARRGQW